MRTLGRLVNFDDRSRDYPVRDLVEGAQPRNGIWACQTFLNQGREGACVGYACAHELASEPAPVAVDASLARTIYLAAQRIDPWEGGAYPGARPQYEGSSVLAGANVLRARGHVPEYRWAFGLKDMVLAVGHLGPAIIGVNWYDGMFDVDQDFFVRVRGDRAGGHAILVTGVNVEMRSFLLHNSWGTGWGRYGQAYISWDDMERLLHEDGESVIPLSRATI